MLNNTILTPLNLGGNLKGGRWTIPLLVINSPSDTDFNKKGQKTS